MSDPYGQADPDGQDLPIAGAPGTGPRLPPSILDEFAGWLERWAVYARANTVQEAAGAAGKGAAQVDLTLLPGAGPPAHWQAAAPQGPPAHWLALFDGQLGADPTTGTPREAQETRAAAQPGETAGDPAEVIRRFQAELAEFLGPPNPNPVSTAPESGPSGPRGTGDPAGSQNVGGHAAAADAAGPVPLEPAPRPGEDAVRRSRGRAGHVSSELEPIPGEGEPGSLPLEQPGSPADSGPARRRVIHFRLRLPPEARPIAANPSPVPAAGAKAGSPGENSNGEGPVPGTPNSPQPADYDQLEQEYQSTQPRVTRLRLGGSQRAKRVDRLPPGPPATHLPPRSSLAESAAGAAPTHEPADSHLEPSPEAGTGPAIPPQLEAASREATLLLAQPGDSIPPPQAVEGPALEPAWQERNHHAEAPPVRWPPAANGPHWPALPEPPPTSDLGPRPYQSPDRRARIDREQGGGSWNG